MKPLKCLLGWHKYGPWELIPYPTIGFDPGLFYWPMQQKKRKCECCGYEEWREV